MARNEYDAHRYLSTSKGGTAHNYTPPRRRKAPRLVTVLWWMAYAVIAAAAFSALRGAL